MVEQNPQQSTPVSNKIRLVFFLLLCFIGFLAILSSTMSKSPILPIFALQIGATKQQIGLIAAASTIPGILISAPAGAIADAIGKQKVLLIALLIFATAPFLYLLVSLPWHLWVVRFYHGFATAIFGTITISIIAESFPKQRAEHLSWYSSATIAGRAIAPILGGGLLSIGTISHVYIACGISGVFALLVGLLLLFKIGKTDLPTPKEKFSHGFGKYFRNLFRLLITPKIFGISLLEAAQYLAYGAIETFIPLYAISLNISNWQIGIILGIEMGITALSRPFAGHLSDKYGRKKIILFGVYLEVLFVGILGLMTSFSSLILVVIGFGFTFAFVTSSTGAYIADISKTTEIASSIGVMSTIMDLGQISGPILVGFIAEQHGYSAAFYTIGALVLLSGIIFTLLFLKKS